MGFRGIKKVLNEGHKERKMLPPLTWIIFRKKKLLIKIVYRMQKWFVSFVLNFTLKSIFFPLALERIRKPDRLGFLLEKQKEGH
jgi:hypothetical protein